MQTSVGKAAYAAKRALAVIAGIALACLLCEAVLRITDKTDYSVLTNDPQSGLLMYRPHSTFVDESSCYSNVATINTIGFHGPDVATDKKSGVFRIEIIGASYIEGSQVPVDQLMSTVLEQKLNQDPGRRYTYEVIPIAYAGNATLLDILYFLRFGAPLQPDLVVDVANGGEVNRDKPTDIYPPRFDADGNVILSLPKSAQESRTVLLKDIARRSKLIVNARSRFILITQAWDALMKPQSANSTPIPTDAVISADAGALWPVEEKLLGTFAKEVQKHHATFMLASWISPFTATSSEQSMTEHLQRIAADQGFSYGDLTPETRAEAARAGNDGLIPCNGHWSPIGHAYIADTLYQYLETHPALISK